VGACAHRNLQELTITKNPLNVHSNWSKRYNQPTLNRCTLGRDLRVLLPHPIAQRRCGAREKGVAQFAWFFVGRLAWVVAAIWHNPKPLSDTVAPYLSDSLVHLFSVLVYPCSSVLGNPTCLVMLLVVPCYWFAISFLVLVIPPHWELVLCDFLCLWCWYFVWNFACVLFGLTGRNWYRRLNWYCLDPVCWSHVYSPWYTGTTRYQWSEAWTVPSDACYMCCSYFVVVLLLCCRVAGLSNSGAGYWIAGSIVSIVGSGTLFIWFGTRSCYVVS
jgi:hypothetical protein